MPLQILPLWTIREIVERRREPRITIDQPIAITVLDDPPIEAHGLLLNISGKGVQLRSIMPIALGAAVKLTLPDALLLGEVCWCKPAGEDGQWLVGLITDQILTHLSHLAALASTLQADQRMSAQEVSQAC